MESISQCKETAVSNLNTPMNQSNDKPQPVALLDCGQASKMTNGLPFMLYFEMSVPPFDRALM